MTPTSIALPGKGRYFDIADPCPADITIDDIALSLSRECRFGNFTRTFYSVAQHSFNVAMQIRAMGRPEPVQFIALLHDAHEAYIGDVPTPHKRVYGDHFRAVVEGNLMKAVAIRFEIDLPHRWPPEIHEADDRLLHAEAFRLMPEADWYDPAKTAVSSMCDFRTWDERLARHKFLELFYQLAPNHAPTKEHA